MIAVCYLIVPSAGLEPARLAADAPKAPVSTQFHHEGLVEHFLCKPPAYQALSFLDTSYHILVERVPTPCSAPRRVRDSDAKIFSLPLYRSEL